MIFSNRKYRSITLVHLERILNSSKIHSARPIILYSTYIICIIWHEPEISRHETDSCFGAPIFNQFLMATHRYFSECTKQYKVDLSKNIAQALYRFDDLDNSIRHVLTQHLFHLSPMVIKSITAVLHNLHTLLPYIKNMRNNTNLLGEETRKENHNLNKLLKGLKITGEGIALKYERDSVIIFFCNEITQNSEIFSETYHFFSLSKPYRDFNSVLYWGGLGSPERVYKDITSWRTRGLMVILIYVLSRKEQ